MLYAPGAIVASDLDIAQGPYFGGEFLVYLTRKPAVLAYELEVVTVTADPNGEFQDLILTPTPGVTLPSGGVDLQVALRSPILSPIEISLGGAGTNAANNETDLFANFGPPPRSANQSFNFERGTAVDLAPTNGLAKSVENMGILGGNVGAKFGIFQLPELADYTFIGCTTEMEFNTRARIAKGVDCGMESDAFVKRGKTQPGMLSIGSKLKGFMDGLTRFDGAKCTCMMIGLKDGQVLAERLVFTQFVPTIKPKLPEGDGEATLAGEGKFVEQLFFTAPDGGAIVGGMTDSDGDRITDSDGNVILI